jgi:hypothetical protein
MFALPIIRPRLNRLTGVDPFEGQSLELVLYLLLSADQALHVGLDSKPLSLRSGAYMKSNVCATREFGG